MTPKELDRELYKRIYNTLERSVEAHSYKLKDPQVLSQVAWNVVLEINPSIARFLIAQTKANVVGSER